MPDNPRHSKRAKHTHPPDAGKGQNSDVSSPPRTLKFRNYVAQTTELRQKKSSSSSSLSSCSASSTSSSEPSTSSTHLVLPSVQKAKEIEDVLRQEESLAKLSSSASIAPKKPNWDLKRDVEHRLKILDRRTHMAIRELIKERLEREDATSSEEDSDARAGYSASG